MHAEYSHAAPPIPEFSEAQKSLITELLVDDQRMINPAFCDAQKEGPPVKPDKVDTQKDLRTALLNIDRVVIALENIAFDLATLRASLVTALLRCNEAGKVDHPVINMTSDTPRQPATAATRIEEPQ